MKNRFKLNESEKNRIKGLYGIVIEQDDDDYDFGSDPAPRTRPPSDDTWPFTMERYEFENKVPGGTGLPEECDKCLMATIPEQYLDRVKRFEVFKIIVKLIISYQLTQKDKPKLSDITALLKAFSPLGAIKIAKDLFKCVTNECSPKKIHTYRVEKGFDPTNVTGYRN